MVSATPDAGRYFWGGTLVEPVSGCCSLCFRETGIRGQENKAPKLPPKSKSQVPETKRSRRMPPSGAFRPLPGNFRKRRTAWWAREDSNLQPDRYERPALTIELRALASAAQAAVWPRRCPLSHTMSRRSRQSWGARLAVRAGGRGRTRAGAHLSQFLRTHPTLPRPTQLCIFRINTRCSAPV
jgi:hypothetical protein